MSLKAIKEALDLLRDVPGRSPLLAQAADRAEAEIAALEKAAPVAVAAFTGDIHGFKTDRLDQCVAVLDAIAKEAE
jgi:hypothetical protein